MRKKINGREFLLVGNSYLLLTLLSEHLYMINLGISEKFFFQAHEFLFEIIIVVLY